MLLALHFTVIDSIRQLTLLRLTKKNSGESEEGQ